MTSSPFEILGLTPTGLASPSLAAAVARAGGTGLLNLEFCRDAAQARAQFASLLPSARGTIGLRLTAAQLELGRELLALAGERALTLILCGPVGKLAALAKSLGVREQDRLLAEVSDVEGVKKLQARFQGLVVHGHEAGGWVGEYTSYILLQKLRGQTALPLYVQGGVGVYSAAACRAAGAAGVVLDDQLLLLAESPLSPAQQNELSRLNGAETRLYGELVDRACRVYARPASPALKAADELNRQVEGGLLKLDDWQQKMLELVGWSSDASLLAPLGQGIGLAVALRDRYRSVARLVQAIRRAVGQQLEQAARLRFLDENGPLAQSHGTRFPLAQGPMTRVSDSPEFAVEVAKGGALPFLALALMRGDQVRAMLEKTRELAGDKPWGVGLLGFIPQALREEQCAEIWKCPPPYALIAGGRPDQAAEFEKRGIKTYIHAPAPALLKLYLEQGARRFVFEGRECGGHIGPLSSFTLWEEMIEVLLQHVQPGEEKDVHVLFAGGVHDAVSGAMVAAMTAPLAARGMKVGALMGTAYLFTEEIVSTGAIVDGFQQQALACERTKNLETGPGHATRCAATQFADDFFAQRRELIRKGTSAEEIRDVLEDLNLGRLRIASKGVNRDDAGKIVSIAPEQQLADGMYMIGQVATLREKTISVAGLHEDVSSGAQALLNTIAQPKAEARAKEKPADIAIVGIGVVLPKADAAYEYWNNVLNKVSVIREAPEWRWDWKLYFDENRKTRDKIYSRWGGFLDEIQFDPTRFGIPPKSMKSIDPMQLLALEAASRALDDAGYTKGGFDRETTSVILGASGGAGELGLQYGLRAELPRFVENISDDVWDRLPEWTEESFAGILPNVAAGRIANRMDFGGLNLTLDAACASSLAAISMAVTELESGRSSMVLAGGYDTTQSAYGFTTFAKTQALSPTGKAKTFDEAADGITISEGVVIMVLKRLADAEADGDRIYAVVKATAGSSDGKALGLTAPRSEGQVRALDRAYAKAGFSPKTLGLVEAHGTGTAVGDRAEAQTITRALRAEQAAPRSVALGSVKTLLGHTKAAAGVAGLAKVAMALHHRTLPAHVGVSKPIDTLADPSSPAYLLKEPRPWLANPEHPRRGGASAFGFGGTNFHAVLEEYAGNAGAPGSSQWPQELFLLRAASREALIHELEALRARLGEGSRIQPAELAYTLARQAETRSGAVALALVASDIHSLARDLNGVLAHLHANRPLPPSARLNTAVPASAPAVAYLFPGQGSQHLNMGREAALYTEELREALELSDRALSGALGLTLSGLMLPPAAFDEATEAAQTQALTNTRVAQPAIGTLSMGYLHLARRLGLRASAAAGHSYGEYSALYAAGVIDAQDFLKLSAVRGSAMAEASAKASEAGGMAAIAGRREQVSAQLAGFSGVSIANHNAPEQCVISGPRSQVEAAVQKLSAAGLRTVMLPVSGAFHTPMVAAAQPPLSAAIHAANFSPAQFPVYSNQTAKPYPAQPAQMQKLLDAHMLSSVEFVAEIEAMYAAGSRVFLELGPKGVCANMAKQILAGKNDVLTVSLDGNGGGLRGLLLGLAELHVAGVQWQPSALFAARDLATYSEAQLNELAKPKTLPKHLWLLSGGCARPIDDPLLRTGSKPALTQASAETARREQLDKLAASLPARTIQVPVAAPAASTVPVQGLAGLPGVSPALGGDALVAYQQTMRQFLSLQERVLQQFLGGQPGTVAPSLPMPAATAAPLATPALAAPAAIAPPLAAAVAPVAKPASPAPVSPAVAPVALSIDYQSLLTGIVAERTGYPTEMLALDADLEADLGIDSIKRVEILGAFQKGLPAATGAQMQASMERFTKAKTLNAILAEIRSIAPAAAPANAPVAAAAAVAAPQAVTVDYQSLLIGIVAERTGYPTEMLALDADLEADLGIDSIKRVEILGALQKALPAELGAQMQASMERYTKAKSLSAILSQLPQQTVAAAAPLAVAVAVAPAAAAVDYQSLLIGIVAERTGYPTEMLALDADLEADLGIDSIKRVEILGALQKALPAELGAQMQASMERYTKAKSLSAILAQLPQQTIAAAAAPVAIAVAVAPAAAAVDYQSLLIGIVAERTGYPTEMLALDADLEADLGIDSIKRVEILGALQKALPAELGAQMQASMERYTKAKTLSAILAQLPQQTVAAAAAPVAIAVAVAPAAASVDYQSLLIGIVAERTGYPTEMLALDADLEADLGIDSIKRVEILGALQKALPAELGAQMQASMERYTKAKSLSAILAQLPALGSAPAAAALAPSPAAAVVAAPAREYAPTPRYVMKSRPAPLPKTRAKLSGLALLLGGPAGLVAALSQALRAEGLTPVTIAGSEPQALRAAISAARQQHGAARAVLHLFGMEAAQPQDLAAWRGCYQRDILSLFHGLKAIEGDLDTLRALAATRFGGSFGRDTIDEGMATGGGANGLFNCLRQEYPKSVLRAVDFDGQSEAEIAAILCAELASDCSEPEVAYADSTRRGYTTSAQPLSASPFPAAVTPSGDWVVLVTGGARGITAEIVEELVRPGMRVVLLGRTAVPGAEPADTAALADAAQLKSAILKRRLAAGEKPKPVEIDREVSRVLVDREIRQNLARLTAAGAQVDYLACDVRDEAAFGQVIDGLYERHGKIDAVLHGAGVIEDKLFADKTAESFERVLGTKLDAAFVLSQRLRPQSLKLMAFFTSVAGRYGNQGQGDYASANETLNRLAWQLQHSWSQTRVIAINWGPWDAGMASEAIRRAFAERGIEAIPVPSGRRFFLEELLHGPRHDVEIVAGAGPWYSGEHASAETAAPVSAGPSALPLLRGAPRMGPGGNMMLDHQFSLESDPYLLDHRIDGKGVLPATAALEWMAQFVSAAWPGWHVIEIRDLRQMNSVMLDPEHEGKRSVQLRARASSHSDFSGQTVTVEIVDPANKKLPFYRATAVLLQQPPQAAPASSVTALKDGKSFAAHDAYAHFLFHGPRFQLAREIPAVSADGLDALLRPTLPGEWLPDAQGRWLFDPGLLDVAPQMAIVWARINRNMTALPSAFSSVRRYGSGPLPAQLKLSLRMLPAPHESAVVYDALFFDEQGQLRLEMRGCESTMSAALNRLGGQAATSSQDKPQESA